MKIHINKEWRNKLRKIHIDPCSIGSHKPSVMIHSVTHERAEDVCIECGKKLATYKMVRISLIDSYVKNWSNPSHIDPTTFLAILVGIGIFIILVNAW
jgi:hypothetical protein